MEEFLTKINPYEVTRIFLTLFPFRCSRWRYLVPSGDMDCVAVCLDMFCSVMEEIFYHMHWVFSRLYIGLRITRLFP